MTGTFGVAWSRNALVRFSDSVSSARSTNELIDLRLTIEQKFIDLIEFHDRMSRQ